MAEATVVRAGNRAALANAIAEAVPAAEAELRGEVAPVKAAEVTVAPAVTEDPVVKTEPAPSSTEASPEVESDEDEEDPAEAVPTSLFGVDLSNLDDATRAEFVREWTEQNKIISKSQREAAETKKELEAVRSTAPTVQPAPADEPDVTQLSDEELAEALGLDLENAIDPQAAKLNLALTRKVLELTSKVENVQATATESAQASTWKSALDTLEARFGELPVDRETLVANAKARGIADPEAAFWVEMGPVRQSLVEALDKKLGNKLKGAKKAATTPRPKTSAAVEPAALTSKNAKDAVKEAFERAMAEKGMTFSQE